MNAVPRCGCVRGRGTTEGERGDRRRDRHRRRRRRSRRRRTRAHAFAVPSRRFPARHPTPRRCRDVRATPAPPSASSSSVAAATAPSSSLLLRRAAPVPRDRRPCAGHVDWPCTCRRVSRRRRRRRRRRHRQPANPPNSPPWTRSPTRSCCTSCASSTPDRWPAHCWCHGAGGQRRRRTCSGARTLSDKPGCRPPSEGTPRARPSAPPDAR